MNVIYEQLNKYVDVDYDIVGEEYKTINNIEYYYITVKLKIGKTSRIGFGKVDVSNPDYKSEALVYALGRSFTLMPNINNNYNANIINNDNNVNKDIVNNESIINNDNNTNNANNEVEKDVNNTNNTNNKSIINNFTKETIIAVKKYQVENNITSNEKFLYFLKAWKPSIKSASELTEESTKEFLNWASKK